MRKILWLLLFCAPCFAQSVGPISITSTQCASISADQKATVAIQVTGTWTGTLQPSVAIAGRPAANIQVTPSTTSTAQSTITANGGYSAKVAGFTYFQVCGASVISGTAKVYLNASPKSR